MISFIEYCAILLLSNDRKHVLSEVEGKEQERSPLPDLVGAGVGPDMSLYLGCARHRLPRSQCCRWVHFRLEGNDFEALGDTRSVAISQCEWVCLQQIKWHGQGVYVNSPLSNLKNQNRRFWPSRMCIPGMKERLDGTDHGHTLAVELM
jgi:hypothetical protein